MSWTIQAKLSVYLWLGVVSHKGHFFDGLPIGYDLSHELRNAERPGAMAPNNIHYLEKYVIIYFYFIYYILVGTQFQCLFPILKKGILTLVRMGVKFEK